MKRTAVALALLALASGCAREGAPGAGRSGEVPTPRAPVPPVAWERLVPFLPPAPAGWVAPEAFGEDVAGKDGFHYSTARRVYRGPGALEATVTDSGYHPPVAASVSLGSQLAKETAEGWRRGVTIDGNPGVEVWKNDGTNAELTVLVGHRYVVHLRGARIPEGFLRTVWGSVDVKGLADLK